MKSFGQISCAAVAAAAVALTGCGRREASLHANEPEGVTFDAKRGLLVPAATAQFIGLQLADVEERKITAAFQFSARIYRTAGETKSASPERDDPSALASGYICPEEAGRLSEGQPVTVQSAGGEMASTGRILALNRGVEKASGQVEVLLAISDAQRLLAPGAFVSATVSLGGDKNVVSVPRSALFRTTEGDFVYTVSGGHFVRAAVKPGVVNAGFAEITDGLYAGDQVVVRPVMTLWLAELQSLRGGKACADGH